jgi:hypothetical protein
VPSPRPPEPPLDAAPWLDLFASTAPGVEAIAGRELQALGALDVEAVPGGVTFRGDRAGLYRANLWLRSAGRVLQRVAVFRARDFTALRKRAARVEWERTLREGDAVVLRVACHKSRLYHSGAVAERVLGAMQDRLGFAPRAVAPAEAGADDAADAISAPREGDARTRSARRARATRRTRCPRRAQAMRRTRRPRATPTSRRPPPARAPSSSPCASSTTPAR